METVIASTLHDSSASDTIFYPDSDGLPMANNTEHLKRIVTTQHGLESIFADRDDVVVGADLFWYPVKGKPKTVLAPDIFVVFGRPKGERKSYQQWREDGIAPQVVFKFLSDSNTTSEMSNKAIFFERYGVQEYYLYDIERKQLSGFVRFQEQDDQLESIPDMTDWKSPRLGIRFDMSSEDLQLYKPDGKPFLGYDEYAQIEIILEETCTNLGQTREQLGQAREQLGQTQYHFSNTAQKLDESKHRANSLAAKLRELGINPETIA
jgi:Uma2 family endonuclease